MEESKMKAQNKPEKIDLLELSDSEKATFIKETKKNLRKRLVEAKFWRTLAENKRIVINGLAINLENSSLQPF
jgi:hypothetical protein